MNEAEQLHVIISRDVFELSTAVAQNTVAFHIGTDVADTCELTVDFEVRQSRSSQCCANPLSPQLANAIVTV